MTQRVPPSTPTGSRPSTIRITNPANISNVPLHIALDGGYFAEEGLDVQADIDLGAGSTVEAVIGNQVDMAWVNLGGALQPYSEGIDLRLVQISDHGKPGGMEVLVKQDSPAQTLTDLIGKTLAVLSPSTTCVWLVKKALLDAGQPVDAITMTEVSPPDHPVVLESGNVDATCTTDPTRTMMTSEFGARPIFDAATDGVPELRSYPVGGYVVSGDFAEQNPKALAAFQRALTKAAAYANSHPDEVRAKLSTFTTADPEIADQVVINEYVETSDMGIVDPGSTEGRRSHGRDRRAERRARHQRFRVAEPLTPMAPEFSGGGLVGNFADRPAAYTDEEQRNIETALRLRRASFEERKAFHGPGFVVHRRGMAHLARVRRRIRLVVHRRPGRRDPRHHRQRRSGLVRLEDPRHPHWRAVRNPGHRTPSRGARDGGLAIRRTARSSRRGSSPTSTRWPPNSMSPRPPVDAGCRRCEQGLVSPMWHSARRGRHVALNDCALLRGPVPRDAERAFRALANPLSLSPRRDTLQRR